MLLDLISQDVELRKVTADEWAGPCPWCGGTDRLHMWERDQRWKCLGFDEGRNGCGRHGDAIQWLRDHRGLSFLEAAAITGKSLNGHSSGGLRQSATQIVRPPEIVDQPVGAWQDKAWDFLTFAQDELDSERGGKAEFWLAQRGIDARTARQAGIGYWPMDTYADRADWGLEPDTNSKGKPKRVWCPRGIVIPWTFGGYIWRIRFRRPLTGSQVAKGEDKYIQLPGSSNGLYGAGDVARGLPVVLVESELDALLLQQEAGDICTPVATGGTGGARRPKWIGMLAAVERVLIAYDADEPGEKAAQWWKAALPNGRIWRPLWGDQTDMMTDGADLALWVSEGLK